MSARINDHGAARGAGCRRCGTCCLKGGPALHLADRALVAAGIIPLNALVTVRQGEPAFDNVRGRCEPAPTDIIKIAGSGDQGRACTFYSREDSACAVYQHRPLECQALACWDTAALEALYQRDRLTRCDLIGSVAGLWELVRDHQARCSYDRLADLVLRLKSAWSEEVVGDLLYLIRYDLNLRKGVSEHTPRHSGILSFLFGLPLAETIRRYGLRLSSAPAGATLQWIDPSV